jgi:hypothetical protein
MTQGVALSDGKEKCERLMNEAISFAEKMLRKRKEFYRYAYVLRPNGEVAMIAGYDGTEKPKSQDIIDILRTSLMDEAAAAKVSECNCLPEKSQTQLRWHWTTVMAFHASCCFLTPYAG